MGEKPSEAGNKCLRQGGARNSQQPDRQGLGPSTAAGCEMNWGGSLALSSVSDRTSGKKKTLTLVRVDVCVREDRGSCNQRKGNCPAGFHAFALPGTRWRTALERIRAARERGIGESEATRLRRSHCCCMLHVAWWTRRIDFRVCLLGMDRAEMGEYYILLVCNYCDCDRSVPKGTAEADEDGLCGYSWKFPVCATGTVGSA